MRQSSCSSLHIRSTSSPLSFLSVHFSSPRIIIASTLTCLPQRSVECGSRRRTDRAHRASTGRSAAARQLRGRTTSHSPTYADGVSILQRWANFSTAPARHIVELWLLQDGSSSATDSDRHALIATDAVSPAPMSQCTSPGSRELISTVDVLAVRSSERTALPEDRPCFPPSLCQHRYLTALRTRSCRSTVRLPSPASALRKS